MEVMVSIDLIIIIIIHLYIALNELQRDIKQYLIIVDIYSDQQLQTMKAI